MKRSEQKVGRGRVERQQARERVEAEGAMKGEQRRKRYRRTTKLQT